MKSLSQYLLEGKAKTIEPTVDNLKKALQLCAKAHNAKFKDWSEDEQFGIEGEKVPLVADVRMIAKAFYNDESLVETGWGYTTLYFGEDFAPKVNMAILNMALPNGWVSKI